MRIHTVFSISLSMIVVGCAIRPLPKNVTRDTTLQIINKIRCESRDALVVAFIAALKEEANRENAAVSEKMRNLAVLKKLGEQGTSEKVIRTIDRCDVGPIVRARVEKFQGTSIGYAFRFKITENKEKKFDVGTGFRVPFTNGTFTLGLAGGSSKTRDNERKIELDDIFSNLANGGSLPDPTVEEPTPRWKLTGLVCGDPDDPDNEVDRPREHWIYPITGKIGMAELITTFIRLEKTSGTVSKFNDTLQFTTVFDASVNPGVTLNPGPINSFRLAKANATLTAKRTDLHEVAVGLTKASQAPKRGGATLPLGDDGVSLKLIYPNGVSISKPIICPEDAGIPSRFRPRRVSRRSLFYTREKEAARTSARSINSLRAEESLRIGREIRDELPGR